MTDWYYEENGTQRGPIKEADLATMFANRFLPLEARVWSAALGSEWTPASQTKFKDSVSVAPPILPPLPGAQPSPAPTAALPQPSAARKKVEAPGISSYCAEVIAFSPLAMLLVDVTAKAAKVDPSAGDFNNASQLWWTLAVIVVCVLDVRQLNRKGLNPGNRWITPFVLLSPVGYFWRRAAIVGGGWRYLWLWLGCAVIGFAGELAYVIDG
ncbi:DUF4339 domain-containing protein [Mesorhizobium sp.]|uniref:DUF4339 domain-containing protein n=1 Tax=Mesorhizobium sp. TaxID=1871066 RepID=UPI000FE8F498|nr:DUF4339 domain-containing protein [Mesorhizobium sp.]RWH17615.1 MAG: DUF4339 domain-containing protein [Mesorhizobium sp.]RWH33210.1 MAG: DUF4339 domain-containing protein [Mesorhizobium sp.]TIR56292.1 MAG: DUF4339 domain-containing protein [Mesorhizobium sp.]TIR67161.1 MAG: DUF4339 domain-containing protein [Mesorhizobium sp.]